MTDWLSRPMSVFMGRFYFFRWAATAVVVAEQARFIIRFPSFTNQTLGHINVGTVSNTMFMCQCRVLIMLKFWGVCNKLSRNCKPKQTNNK